ncbi:MAG: methyl-accepting chemotaxis protein [Steroidobacteraceae bacterium]
MPEKIAADGNEASVDHHVEAVISLSRRMLDDVLESVSHISAVNRASQMLSMNARIEAARAGNAGLGFSVVAQELTRLSGDMGKAASDIVAKSQTTGVALDEMIARLSTQVRDNRLCDLALANIDLIDRNLYERSCDVRWWATDATACDCLQNPDESARRLATRRLGQILDSYTVYFDLALVDLTGTVIANGRPEKFRSQGMNVAEAAWFQAALATGSGSEYGFQSVHASPLVNDELALVYSCVVREGGRVNGRPLGVLGIVFAWEALGQTVVKRTPLSREEWQKTRVCIIDDSGQVLADSEGRLLKERLAFEDLADMLREKRSARTVKLGTQPVRVAHAASPGFETYRTGWHSLVIRKLA